MPVRQAFTHHAGPGQGDLKCGRSELVNRVPPLLKAPGPHLVIEGLLCARGGALGMQRVETTLTERESIAIVAIARLLLGGLAVVRGQ